jgi:hypothetical protein
VKIERPVREVSDALEAVNTVISSMLQKDETRHLSVCSPKKPL